MEFDTETIARLVTDVRAAEKAHGEALAAYDHEFALAREAERTARLRSIAARQALNAYLFPGDTA
jgi:hypothetical protein